jgi:hypothetical protein
LIDYRAVQGVGLELYALVPAIESSHVRMLEVVPTVEGITLDYVQFPKAIAHTGLRVLNDFQHIDRDTTWS